ncbi:DUF1643 domain-containing protein [Roseimarinus sediminis]|uniref:DUF1643 domain-containing protein n=1 Tax=Roseimarinus sediminis TaxID=1610899 RepID=UPI003D20EC42
MNNLFCIPEGNKDKRFLIGEIGNSNILCIGINPNTADENNLDPTSSNIKRITTQNGYDGWVLANLDPRRNSKAENLEQEPGLDLILENVRIIEAFILENNITDVWIAWDFMNVRKKQWEDDLFKRAEIR